MSEYRGRVACWSAWVAAVAVMMAATAGRAAEAPAAATMTKLPQAQEYQRVLRAYMATLTEKDFEPGVTNPLTVQPSSQDKEYEYRNYLLSLLGSRPLVGSKRGMPAVNAPAFLFLLSSVEGTNAVMKPPVWPEALVTFAQWDYPGNSYRNSDALKRRAFVTAGINLIMIDDYIDKTATSHRSDWMASQLINAGAAYRGFQAVLPKEVQQAYQDGLKKLARRLIEWGPKGEEANMDTAVPLALWYASQACNDPGLTKDVESYARMVFTDPRHAHPGGYWVERGGLDVGFGGQANFFAVWTALASDWPFAKEAVERTYRLRAHLCLPEPDGSRTGPSHFNTRLGCPACDDQWAFGGDRDQAAVMFTDEAACWVNVPAVENGLTNSAANLVAEFNRQIAENPGFVKNADIRSSPWAWGLWPNWNFPVVTDFAYEFCRKGAYANLVRLQKKNSPFLVLPFQREGTFVRDFGKAFFVAKMPSYGVILHTGPVGHQDPNDGLAQFKGPMGLGGGQLSAFWTPAAGPAILGRRAGMSWDATFDKLDAWRLWPIHAVSGCTADGKVFTSARILRPDVTDALTQKGGTVKVSGMIAGDELGQTNVLQGALAYARTFTVGAKSLRVETRVTGDGKDKIAELYETLPVYVCDGEARRTNVGVAIEFQAAGNWMPGATNFQDKVTAIKITRYAGAVQITFDQPRRVKLAPAEWADTFLSRAICRNILIDLLEGAAAPAAMNGEKVVGYEIAATAK